MRQKPPGCDRGLAANSEGLSKRGQQSQSTEPCCDTSAAERPSPIAA